MTWVRESLMKNVAVTYGRGGSKIWHFCGDIIFNGPLLRRSQTFKFLGLKYLSPVQFWGALTHADMTEF